MPSPILAELGDPGTYQNPVVLLGKSTRAYDSNSFWHMSEWVYFAHSTSADCLLTYLQPSLAYAHDNTVPNWVPATWGMRGETFGGQIGECRRVWCLRGKVLEFKLTSITSGHLSWLIFAIVLAIFETTWDTGTWHSARGSVLIIYSSVAVDSARRIRDFVVN